MADIIQYPSPNYGERREGKQPNLLILHYTDMLTAKDALDRMCDPQAEVSAHYLIDEDGQIYQLVDEAKRAWHAGVSFWQGETDINSISIGIELANTGHSNGPLKAFPKEQIDSLMTLSKSILKRHPISIENVIGHSDIAPGRKIDPGPLFPWQELSENGLGIWPHNDEIQTPIAKDEQSIREALENLGYDVSDLKQSLSAFQLHFRPIDHNGEMDDETINLLTALTRK